MEEEAKLQDHELLKQMEELTKDFKEGKKPAELDVIQESEDLGIIQEGESEE